MKLGWGRTNGEWLWVPIPKNATAAHMEVPEIRDEWDLLDFRYEVVEMPAYVVVRDPFTRWFAGLEEYAIRSLGGTQPTELTRERYEELLAEVRAGGRPVYDEHTMRQSDWLLSSLADPVLVRMESAGRFLKERLGLDLPFSHSRGRREDESFRPMIEGFYAEDFALYEAAS